jgi:hypothetical protein
LKQEKIEYIGLKSALQLLADKDLRGAEILLNHMNFDSNQKIYQICFFTPYKELRDYLISVLIERKKLNEKEIELINNLKKIELVYPCRSYEKVKNLIKPFDNIEDSRSNVVKNDFIITKDIVEIKNKQDSSENSNRYSHIIIEWLREWSDETINRILADSLILKNEIFFDFINEDVIWSVLIEQNNLDLIMRWIDFSFRNTDKETDLNTNIFKSKLTQQMIDLIYDSRYLPSDSKHILLNYLAKYNVFSTKEKENFNKLIKRLSSSGTLFDKDSFKTKDDQFHINLILSLINQKCIPVDFLWSYLNYYK